MSLLQSLGGLYVRGYAFQASYPTWNVTFLPELEEFSPPNFVGGLTAEFTQVNFDPTFRRLDSAEAVLTVL